MAQEKLNIYLTEQQLEYVEDQVDNGRYSSKTEYFRDKVREDMPQKVEA